VEDLLGDFMAEKKLRYTRIGGLVKTVFLGIVLLYFAAPVLLVLVSSFGRGYYLEFPPPGLSLEWYRAFIQDASWMRALLTSVVIAVVVSLIDVPIASMAAYWIERTSLPVKTRISTFLLIPALIPVITYAVAFYGTFANWSFFDSRAQLAIAHAVLALPYVFLVMRAGFSSLDPELEDAARTLGAGRFQLALSILLPLLKWHFFIAALISFMVSFTEPVMAIFLTSGEAVTLPMKAWEGLRYGIDPRTVIGTALLIYVFLLAILGVSILKMVPTLKRRFQEG